MRCVAAFSQRSPVGRDDDLADRSRPVHIRADGRNTRILTAHTVILTGIVLIALHLWRIDDDSSCYARQGKQVSAHRDLCVPGQRDLQNRLCRENTRILDKGTAGSYGDIVVGRQIEHRVTAENHRKGAMRIAPEDLLKGDLIHDMGIIKATLPIGEGDRSAAPKPRGDLGQAACVLDESGAGQHQIVIDILAFQRGQAAGAPGDIGERGAFRRKRNGGVLCYMDAVLRAFRAVPFKPVCHEYHLEKT